MAASQFSHGALSQFNGPGAMVFFKDVNSVCFPSLVKICCAFKMFLLAYINYT